MNRKLIITADDFGISEKVNRAIEKAHQSGILHTASLMPGGNAFQDALERARRLPALRIGLHLALVDAHPVLTPEAIPDLVDAQGRLASDLVRAGFSFFFKMDIRRQLAGEIRAQFEAFQKTGLVLDHVNSHHHMHLHPTINELMIRIGVQYGMKAVRYPREPVLSHFRDRFLLLPWLNLLRNRLAKAGIRSNDAVFGISESGRMSLDRTVDFIRHLPPGVTEIFFHPGAANQKSDTMDSAKDGDLAILLHPALRQAIEASEAEQISFEDL
jgi:hopanoid biosynthesis associated protein HpnK